MSFESYLHFETQAAGIWDPGNIHVFSYGTPNFWDPNTIDVLRKYLAALSDPTAAYVVHECSPTTFDLAVIDTNVEEVT